jgi:hypothetical protein
MNEPIHRRGFLGRSAALCGGVLAASSLEDQTLLAQLVDRTEYGKPKDPVKGLPRGKLGKYELSRLFIGGNLISGSAHADELLYQSALMTHYFTTEKILETWRLAEENGINTTLMRADPHIFEHYRKFTHEHSGKLHWIAQSAPEQGNPIENAKHARDQGAIGMYYHGGVCDKLVKAGQTDAIGPVLSGIRQTGLLGGIGAHSLDTVKACVAAGFEADFYMLTVNQAGYCTSDPNEVAAFMKSIKTPWIGFKVLGAGRVKPQDGFRHAFQRGADFIAVGMFDWQITEDVQMAKEVLGTMDRLRPWCG